MLGGGGGGGGGFDPTSVLSSLCFCFSVVSMLPLVIKRTEKRSDENSIFDAGDRFVFK